MFCSVFFLSSGSRIWTWLLGQAGGTGRRVDGAARAGWATFAGYTRGIVIIAATNAVLVFVALLILRVPLAFPLAVLTFFAAFIPLIGSPIALFVATLVALAARGPLIALLVLALIVVIGQIEGHLLHPLVMSRAVNLHPARRCPHGRLRNRHRRCHRCRRRGAAGRGDLDGLDGRSGPNSHRTTAVRGTMEGPEPDPTAAI